MGVNDIRSMIRQAEPELRAAGVLALYLFGSQARGEAGDGSDVDVAIEIDPRVEFSLVEMGEVHAVLEETLGRDVDVVLRDRIHPDLRERIERELVRLL